MRGEVERFAPDLRRDTVLHLSSASLVVRTARRPEAVLFLPYTLHAWYIPTQFLTL